MKRIPTLLGAAVALTLLAGCAGDGAYGTYYGSGYSGTGSYGYRQPYNTGYYNQYDRRYSNYYSRDPYYYPNRSYYRR